MPLLDWQFYAVTLAMLWGLWTVVRQFLPKPGAPACGGCAAGSAACAKTRAAMAGSAATPVRPGARPRPGAGARASS